MDLFTIIVIGIVLSIDSFAVSAVDGFSFQHLDKKFGLKIAFTFVFFQTLMPFLGWLIGSGIEEQIKSLDHWLAFFLLAFLGVKMIIEGIVKKTDIKIQSVISGYQIALQGIATSIDAFVVGISLAFLDISIIKVLVIIALSTLIFSYSGWYVGKHMGMKYRRSAYPLGGIVLILIGIKILIEHLSWA